MQVIHDSCTCHPDLILHVLDRNFFKFCIMMESEIIEDVSLYKKRCKKCGIVLCYVLMGFLSIGATFGGYTVTFGDHLKICLKTGVVCIVDIFEMIPVREEHVLNYTSTTSQWSQRSNCHIDCRLVKIVYPIFMACFGISLLCNVVYVMLKVLHHYK